MGKVEVHFRKMEEVMKAEHLSKMKEYLNKLWEAMIAEDWDIAAHELVNILYLWEVLQKEMSEFQPEIAGAIQALKEAAQDEKVARFVLEAWTRRLDEEIEMYDKSFTSILSEEQRWILTERRNQAQRGIDSEDPLQRQQALKL